MSTAVRLIIKHGLDLRRRGDGVSVPPDPAAESPRVGPC